MFSPMGWPILSQPINGLPENYFTDGSISLACPPLKALLEIMAYGQTAQGLDLDSPELRAMFIAKAYSPATGMRRDWMQSSAMTKRA